MFSIAQKDEFYMRKALGLAEQALEEGEVPVGALVVCNDIVIAKGYNQVERLNDVTAHAEMIAITSAAEYLGGKYLNDCELYVTLEPCLMCGTAIKYARFKRVIFGAHDDRMGFTCFDFKTLHPKTEITSGVIGHECSEVLRTFFDQKRKK